MALSYSGTGSAGAAVPDAELIIAGRNPTDEIDALCSSAGVHVWRDVPDMAQVLRRAWLAAAPMQSGSGIKNKILEAWAVGRPVVLSPITANCLELDAEVSRWIAATPHEAAEKIVRLLRSSQERRQAGAHARAGLLASLVARHGGATVWRPSQGRLWTDMMRRGSKTASSLQPQRSGAA